MSERSPIEDARWDAVEEATELMLEGRIHDALMALRDALKADPRNPYAYFYTGAALFEVGQFESAAEAYRATLRLQPKYLAAQVGLSHCLRILDDPQQARVHAQRALKMSPGDADALYALGLAEAACGQTAVALRTLEAFLQAGPELEVSIEARQFMEQLRSQQPADLDLD